MIYNKILNDLLMLFFNNFSKISPIKKRRLSSALSLTRKHVTQSLSFNQCPKINLRGMLNVSTYS